MASSTYSSRRDSSRSNAAACNIAFSLAVRGGGKGNEVAAKVGRTSNSKSSFVAEDRRDIQDVERLMIFGKERGILLKVKGSE
jgi:hypothetical protein